MRWNQNPSKIRQRYISDENSLYRLDKENPAFFQHYNKIKARLKMLQ